MILSIRSGFCVASVKAAMSAPRGWGMCVGWKRLIAHIGWNRDQHILETAMNKACHIVRLLVIALMSGTFLTSSFTQAAVYGTNAALTGTRSVTGSPAGLQTAESDWQDAVVAWNITDNGNSTYTYVYTFTGFSSPSISHLVIDLTDNAVTDPLAVTNASITDSNGTTPITGGKLEKGNHDGITGDVKFDIGTEQADATYTFTSNRSPVYGDLYVKGGSTNLTNLGFGDQTVSNDVIDYIARPDGAVPEPATLGLLGAATILLLRRRRA
jgi:hypothetical protein